MDLILLPLLEYISADELLVLYRADQAIYDTLNNGDILSYLNYKYKLLTSPASFPHFLRVYSQEVLSTFSLHTYSLAYCLKWGVESDNIDFLLQVVNAETLFNNKKVFSLVKGGHKLFTKHWDKIKEEYYRTYDTSISYMFQSDNQQDICDTIVSMVNKQLYMLLSQLGECNDDKIYVLCHSYIHYKFTGERECYDILCNWIKDEIKPEEEIDVAIVSGNLDFCDYIGTRTSTIKSEYYNNDPASRYLYQEITREEAQQLLLEERKREMIMF